MTTAQLDARFEKFASDLESRLLDKISKLIIGKQPVKRTEIYPIKLTDRSHLPKRPSGIKINELPQVGAVYFIGADIGEGLGGTCDDSAFSVLKKQNNKLKQVAWYANNEINPIEFAGVLDVVGRLYNDAILAPEINRYDATLWQLRAKYGYPNLYRWKIIDSFNGMSSKLGWMTTMSTKPRMLHCFRKLMKSRSIEINDPKCQSAFKCWYDNTATLDSHPKDDHMRALLIAAYIASEVS